MIVGLIVEKYDHKKVGLISVVVSYTSGSYYEGGLYLNLVYFLLFSRIVWGSSRLKMPLETYESITIKVAVCLRK